MKNLIFNYLTLILILVVFPIFIIYYLKTEASINIFTYIGLFLIGPALVFFAIARIQLGRSFQVSAEANFLVTTGIYKKLRHPIYYFGLIFLLGVIILFQKFILIIVWCGLIFIQRKRIENEEKVLQEKFGEKYVEYKKNSWF
jgi:protein-S-isoprenylcysteine O-methyltransferase Ste14